MLQNLVPIQKERHAKTKIKPLDKYLFAKDVHIASVLVNEFSIAASIYPIVFIEDQNEDIFRPVALLGINHNENLFVDSEGNWQSAYVPAILRRYPFALASTGEESRYTICIDEDSDLINDQEGESLFTEEGQESELLQRVKKSLTELQQMEDLTKQFTSILKENNLFTPFNLNIRVADAVRTITGSYVINEQRLRNLSDKVFLELRKKGVLPAIYAHLVSLNQMERLQKLSGTA